MKRPFVSINNCDRPLERQAKYVYVDWPAHLMTILREEDGFYVVTLRGIGTSEQRAFIRQQWTSSNGTQGKIPVDNPRIRYRVNLEAMYRGVRLSVESRNNGTYSVRGVIAQSAIPAGLLKNQNIGGHHGEEFSGEIVVEDPDLVFFVGSNAMYRGSEVHIDDQMQVLGFTLI